jgi:quinol monooxygenase YgiN
MENFGAAKSESGKGVSIMALSVVVHRVKDYRAWRQVYDEVGPMQKAGGVIAESVYQAKDDPNTVLVLHSFESMAAAESYFASPELRDAMQKAGVEGAPRIELFEEAK